MPVVSGGGGGGGNTTAQVVASGKVHPVANAAGVTVDTTTYDDVLNGVGKMTTLVFPGIQGALAFAILADAFPRLVLGSRPEDGLFFGDGTIEPTQNGTNVSLSGQDGLALYSPSAVTIPAPKVAQSAARMNSVSPRFVITSGALPTVQLVTATGAQIVATRDVETITPCTFNPGVATTATVTVDLSPDNVTYSTLGVETEPVGTVLDGTIHLIKVRVPAGWYIKLTVNAQATLGLTTYY